MIVTEKFVFVHLPRTGGTFVSELIRKFFPEAHEIGYHLPRTLLPRQYSHLPVLGAVRNPWEFYVSWYHHVLPRDAATTLISWMTDRGKLGFVGTTRNALNLGVDNQRLDVLIEILPEEVDYGRRHIPNITKEAMRRVRGTGVGYYTFRFNHLFGNADEMFICRQETLRHDLLNFFEAIGAASSHLRDYVLGSEKMNTADHLHYSTYYTPELADLVSIRDRQLVERFGYIFEQASSAENSGGKSAIDGPTTSF
jgi:hypothetical protein